KNREESTNEGDRADHHIFGQGNQSYPHRRIGLQS
ncbi:unnamed protein product, partial [marine sediment metagenome]